MARRGPMAVGVEIGWVIAAMDDEWGRWQPLDRVLDCMGWRPCCQAHGIFLESLSFLMTMRTKLIHTAALSFFNLR